MEIKTRRGLEGEMGDEHGIELVLFPDETEIRVEITPETVGLLRRMIDRERGLVSREQEMLHPSCPICGELKTDGHDPGCELAALIVND